MRRMRTLIIKISSVLCLLLLSQQVLSQSLEVVKLYNAKGKQVKQDKLFDAVKEAELVFFGEEHNSIVSHFLSEQVFDAFIAGEGKAALGMEMFERDQINDLEKLTKEKAPLEEWKALTRVWPNFSDYHGLVQKSLDASAPLIASNIPRKYASALFHGGRDSLVLVLAGHKNEACDPNFVVDRSLSQYAALADGELHMGGKHLVEAQAIKDATMAMSIMEYLKNDFRVFHLNGSYHSDFHQGIMWYVQQEDATKKVVTLSVVSAENTDWDKSYAGKADFIFVVNEAFPVSY